MRSSTATGGTKGRPSLGLFGSRTAEHLKKFNGWFPSPWLKQSPTLYEVSRAKDRALVTESFESYDESFARELEHFHDCVVNGTECRTPPEQARVDIDVLTQMFLRAGTGG